MELERIMKPLIDLLKAYDVTKEPDEVSLVVGILMLLSGESVIIRDNREELRRAGKQLLEMSIESAEVVGAPPEMVGKALSLMFIDKITNEEYMSKIWKLIDEDNNEQ